ncbi:hypothetical protein MMC14_003291 [Varicellaria rhodocarpa]|nr:hypothetical protein [Varicellaria rhodocarpa]
MSPTSENEPKHEDVDLQSRIKEISDRISLNQSSKRAGEYRAVSSAIGAESPIGVLTELRESQERILSVMREIVLLSEERAKREEQRHKEICTLLLSLGVGGASKASFSSPLYGGAAISPQSSQKNVSFYGSTGLTSGVHVISCIMMHLDSMLTHHPQFRKISATDKTFMDIKDWYSMCSNVVNADKNPKMGLRIPKPSDNDFKSAASIAASPVQGRRPVCDTSHISMLTSQSPELMNTVEWVRGALLRCSGSLSPERQCRFRSIQHPFVNDSSELNVATSAKLTMPRRTRHQEFLDLKSSQRKAYMSLILESSFTSDDAVQRAKGAA